MSTQAIGPPVDGREDMNPTGAKGSGEKKTFLSKLDHWLDAKKKVVATRQLIRWPGVAVMVAGAIFAFIQLVHPADVLASVTTTMWTVIVSLKLAMCYLFAAGLVGVYARQSKKMGRIGLIGFVLFGLSWLCQIGFVFAELFILPTLATTTPQYVESYLGIVNGSPGHMDIGPLPIAYAVVGVLYLLGGLMFGAATYRAGVFSRWPAALLTAAAVATPFAVLLPHELQRLVAVPMGVAFVVLGYKLVSERRDQTS